MSTDPSRHGLTPDRQGQDRATHSRADVVRAAGRLFAEKGYHGTSMRDLGAELGLWGSSLYSHISSKEDLLVEVVERGASLFQASADSALASGGSSKDRLKALVAGHVGVVLDHLDEVRTFLNEAGVLDDPHRLRVLEARNTYEAAFRKTLEDGRTDGSLRPDIDVKLAAIFLLSVLNAVERWYRPGGRLDREQLAEQILLFTVHGIGSAP